MKRDVLKCSWPFLDQDVDQGQNGIDLKKMSPAWIMMSATVILLRTGASSKENTKWSKPVESWIEIVSHSLKNKIWAWHGLRCRQLYDFLTRLEACEVLLLLCITQVANSFEGAHAEMTMLGEIVVTFPTIGSSHYRILNIDNIPEVFWSLQPLA